MSLGVGPERTVGVVMEGQKLSLKVTTHAEFVDSALEAAIKNVAADNGLIPLWLEHEVRNTEPPLQHKPVNDALIAGANRCREVLNELALSLPSHTKGEAVINFFYTRRERWATHSSSANLDILWLRKFCGPAGALELHIHLCAALPNRQARVSFDTVIATLQDLQNSRLYGFVGPKPQSEVPSQGSIQKFYFLFLESRKYVFGVFLIVSN